MSGGLCSARDERLHQSAGLKHLAACVLLAFGNRINSRKMEWPRSDAGANSSE